MSDDSESGTKAPKAQIVTAPACRDIFVDGVIGAMIRDGVVRINLVNTRYNVDGSAVEHAVVARMVMSRSGVRNLHAALGKLMGRLTRAGDQLEEAPYADPVDAVADRAAKTGRAKAAAAKPAASERSRTKK